MISEKMAAAINDQIKAEFDSAYIYLGMAAYFQDCNLPGMAHWMEKQYHILLDGRDVPPTSALTYVDTS